LGPSIFQGGQDSIAFLEFLPPTRVFYARGWGWELFFFQAFSTDRWNQEKA